MGAIEAIQGFMPGLFWASVRVSVVIGLVLLIRLALRQRLVVRWAYWLWLLVLLRILMPVAPASPVSVFNLWETRTPAHRLSLPGNVPQEHSIDVTTPVPVLPPLEENSRLPMASTASEPVVNTPSINKMKIAALFWLAGAVVVASLGLISDCRLWLRVRTLRLVTDGRILELFEDCKTEMGVHTVVGLVLTDRISSPCVFGVVRPRVLLPLGALESLSEEQLRFVFLHELAHLKRWDNVLGWCMLLAQSLHWFNPLVWSAMMRMRTDRELACDHRVLSILSDSESTDYGSTIMDLSTGWSRLGTLPSIAGIVENRSLLKRRIEMIAAFKPQPKSRPWLAIVLLLVAGLVTLTDAQNVRPQTIVDRMPQNIFKSLLLYYSFDKDGGNKAVDISGMDNHGRVLGAIYDNGGNGGFRHGGMMFDGKGDTIEIDDIRLKAFTFAVWLNPNIQDVNHRIVFQLKTEECGISIQGNSSHSLGVSIGSGREINDHSYSMHDGPWHYYVVTFNGETVTLYVNGQIAAHGPANMDKTLQGKAILGGSSPSQGEDESCWSGGMDEVALFNQALTYQQVQRLYGLYEGRQETPMAETNIVVSDLTVQPYPAGGLWQAVAKIHNDSDTAVGSFQILFYVNDPQKKQPREYGGGPIVAHGEFNEATLPFSLREDTINTIEVEIDAENNIQETNEDDNHLAIKVMVKDGQVVQLENIHP